MFTKISVLIPTRGRVERLKTLLDSFIATDDGHAELVFRADEDDLETADVLRAYHTVVGPRLGGYRSLPVFYNEMLNVANGDVLMLGNDDMVFKTPGWPSLLLDAANAYPDGLFDFGVTTYNEDHVPFATVSRSAVNRFGSIWDPRVTWGDLFWRDVMRAFGRTIMLPHVAIDHDHRDDAVFLEGDQPAMWRDPQWQARQQQAVDDAIDVLRSV